jgi:hypothetical protein
MSRYKKICSECGIDYKSKGGGSKYCSPSCRQVARAKERQYISCSNCRTDVRYYPNSNHKDNKDVLCSKKCQSEWMSKNAKELGLADRASKMRQHWTEDSWKKSIETRKKNGNIIDWDVAKWKQYWRRCNDLTRKIRKQMLDNWDGYDYIDGEYIKPYLDLPHTHTNYPTLDHIKPRSQCFREGISPYDATKPENLAWTKRVNNSKKSQTKLEK